MSSDYRWREEDWDKREVDAFRKAKVPRCHERSPKQRGEKKKQRSQFKRKTENVIALTITRWSQTTRHSDQFDLQILRHVNVSWAALSIPAPCFVSCLFGKFHWNNRPLRSEISPVFSALTYFQGTLYCAFSPVWLELLDDPSKHFCFSVSSSVPHFSLSINSANLPRCPALTQSTPTVVINFIF